MEPENETWVYNLLQPFIMGLESETTYIGRLSIALDDEKDEWRQSVIRSFIQKITRERVQRLRDEYDRHDRNGQVAPPCS